MLRYGSIMEKIFGKHNAFKFSVLLILLFLLAFFSIFIGPVRLSMSSILNVLFFQIFGNSLGTASPSGSAYVIVTTLREPEILAAIIVGASLSIGGAVVQSIFRNPIAEPYIIGVSSGAALGAVLSIGYGIVFAGFYSTQILAFAFSLGVVFMVYFASLRRGKLPVTYFLLIGISVSLFISAIVAYVIITDTRLAGENEILSWLLGSLQGITWSQLVPVAIIVFVTSAGIMTISRELDIIQMGEEYAGSVGVSVEWIKRAGIILSTLSVSAVVSISGLIGFVGLIMPHVSRLLFGGSNRLVIPASAILGSVFLLSADDVTRTIMVQRILPVGIITSLIGVPVFMYLLRRLAFGYYQS